MKNFTYILFSSILIALYSLNVRAQLSSDISGPKKSSQAFFNKGKYNKTTHFDSATRSNSVSFENATEDNPINLTDRISNPSFESSFTGWINNGLEIQTNGDFSPQKEGDAYVERWVGSPPLPNVSISQTITGLHNGKYTLVIGAQNISQNPDTGQSGGLLFGNDSQSQVRNKGEYSVDFLVIDSTATVGFKTENSQGNWAACDNFRLYYKGSAIDLMTQRLRSLIDSSTMISGKKMRNASRRALDNAVAAANQSLSQNADGNQLANRIVDLQKSLNSASASVKAYLQLQVAIDSAQTLYDSGMSNETSTFLNAINQSRALNEDLNAELVNVQRASAELFVAMLAFRYANASAAEPLDMTSRIVNPKFTTNQEGWKGAGKVGYNAVEFYERTFNMNQRISGLPAGRYVLKAQAFERPKQNDAGADYKAGTESIYAKLYAESNKFSEVNMPLPSLYSHPYTGSGSVNGYVNTMASAEEMFSISSNKNYQIALDNILLDEKDVLTIGVKSIFQQGGYWSLISNFRLEFVGKLSTSDYASLLANRIVKAKQLLNEKMQLTAKQPLKSAISGGQQTLEVTPMITESLIEAKGKLDSCITQALFSKNLYDSLQLKMDYANKVLGWYASNQVKKDSLQPAVAQALVSWNDSTLSVSQLRQAATDLESVTKVVDKKIYTASWQMGDVFNPNNNWSYQRSAQSKDWILFWEKGFDTNNPDSLYYGDRKSDLNWIFDIAQRSFDLYADSLKFIDKGKSKTDTYKMVIRLRYSGDWEASGLGVDNMIGTLTLTPWAYSSRGGQTAAHEVAHSFQYQVHCDNNDDNGWMYGYGENASGNNGWWEQCAQWQAYKVYPGWQFDNEWFGGYLNAVHKHPLHEAPRYENFFLHDYWASRHGLDIIGRLWNKSIRPEDPIEAYKRVTGINQTQLNDEMYDCAAKFATWDLNSLKAYGASAIAARPQPKLNDVGGNYWQIDPSACLENYGHNIIQLNAPPTATVVGASLEGLAGISGYRSTYLSEAGWRYGFVALLKNGTRVYSKMKAVDMQINGGKDSLFFKCPADVEKLWLVVSGAPKSHWRHAWDDDDSNDEQWPYKIRFGNTNLINEPNVIPQYPMPVTLISFFAKVKSNKTVEVSWETADEINNKAYIVERSLDLLTFEKVAEITDVAGNSNQKHSYRIIDEKPHKGTSYYRLVQLDLDGTRHIYRILSVVVDGSYRVFPNPVNGRSFRVNLDEPLTAKISLYSTDGQLIPMSRKVESSQEVLLEAKNNLNSGIYVLKIEERAQMRTHKIIVN